MYILNNALKNIGRNKGRNILLMFIILAVIMASAISITINTTTGAIINDYKNRFGSEVSIDLDIEKLIGSSGSQSTQIELITKEQQYSFAESEFLRESIFTGSISVSPVGLKAVDEAEGVGSIISSDEGIDASDFKIPTTVIKGFSETDADDFEKGLRRIVEGKMFADDGECVISKQFAELNGLDVGDEITVETSVTGDDNTLTLKISGIFEDNTMLGVETLFKSALTNRNNEILVDTEDLFGMPLFESAGSLSVKYYLKDPSMLEAFK
jgi:putative ABC transport system permease protein